MSLVIPSRISRTTQPVGNCTVDITHPLAKYAVALWAGNRADHDALGNEMKWVGNLMYQREGTDGIEQYNSTTFSPSLGYWVDKKIGSFGTSDFFIQVRVDSKGTSPNSSIIGKGDTGITEWMFGSGTSGTNLRFYARSGIVVTQTGADVIRPGVLETVVITRSSGYLRTYVNGVLLASSAVSSSDNFNDTAHHLTIGSADYNGTTFDNARNYLGAFSQAIILKGIGGAAIAAELHRNPWQMFKPVQRTAFVDFGAIQATANIQSNLDIYFKVLSSQKSDVEFTNNIRGSSTTELLSNFNVRGYAAKESALDYNLRGAIKVSSDINYNILTASQLSKVLALEYGIRSNSTTTSDLAYKITSAISKDNLLTFKLRGNLSSEYTTEFTVYESASSNLELSSNVRASLTKQSNISYNVLSKAQLKKDYQLLYNIVSTIPPNWTDVYIAEEPIFDAVLKADNISDVYIKGQDEYIVFVK